MAVLYRIIRYQFETQEQLDHQIDRSLAEGIHLFQDKSSISIVDVPKDLTITQEIFDRLSLGKERYSGCITKRQLREMKERNLP